MPTPTCTAPFDELVIERQDRLTKGKNLKDKPAAAEPNYSIGVLGIAVLGIAVLEIAVLDFASSTPARASVETSSR